MMVVLMFGRGLFMDFGWMFRVWVLVIMILFVLVCY